MTHSYGIARWNVSQNASLLERLFYSFNLNGSVFFVFISGYLYNHIFYPKFQYKKFLSKKIKFVLVPYLICSTLPILYTVFDLNNEWTFHIIFDSGGRDFLPDSIKDQPLMSVLWFLVTGRATYAYWFIPMIIMIFIISPLINNLIRSKYLLPVILMLTPVSMIVHRPLQNTNPLHSLVYFLPIYLLKICSLINRQKIIFYLRSNRIKIIILLSSILLGLIQVSVFNITGIAIRTKIRTLVTRYSNSSYPKRLSATRGLEFTYEQSNKLVLSWCAFG